MESFLIFITVFAAIWIPVGTFISIMYISINGSVYYDEYKTARRRFLIYKKDEDRKNLANKAAQYKKRIRWAVVLFFWPFALVPAILYYPYIWIRNMVRIYKQISADQKGYIS